MQQHEHPSLQSSLPPCDLSETAYGHRRRTKSDEVWVCESLAALGKNAEVLEPWTYRKQELPPVEHSSVEIRVVCGGKVHRLVARQGEDYNQFQVRAL